MTSIGVCSSCSREISITSAGLIRSHGPIGDRCSSSGKPPRQSPWHLDAASPLPSSSREMTPSPRVRSAALPVSVVSLEPIVRVRVLDRIPKAARHQCCLKLTTILDCEMELSRCLELAFSVPYPLPPRTSEIER